VNEPEPEEFTRRLLDEAGKTYAEEAGIRLDDKPMPLFELLVLCMLASKPIDATVAMRAARETFAAKLRTPDTVLEANRRTMIDAFGRAGYARYDESSATRLVDMATAVRDEYDGDTGADIFLREVQDVWTWVRPYFDRRAIQAAKQLGLPGDADELAQLAGSDGARLAAALVRVPLDDDLRDKLLH